MMWIVFAVPVRHGISISRTVSAQIMESRLLFLPRRLSFSSGACASAAAAAGEISALLTARRLRDSVDRAEHFIRSKAVTASGVPKMYLSVAAEAPSGQPLYLSDAASALVEASARAALPDGALRLLEVLVDTPAAPLPSGSSCGHLMVKLLSLGRRQDACRVFGTLAAAGDGQRSKAIDELWKAGRGADAVKVFGEIADTAPAPNLSTYVAMMNGYLKKGDLESASKLRTQMGRAGMRLFRKQREMLRMLAEARACPGNDHRNVLIEICIMAQDIDEAIRCLRHMGDNGTAPPNAHSYNLVIAGLWKARRGDDAVKVFGQMADMFLAPNHFTYNVMINGHLRRLSIVLTPKKNENQDLEAALELRAQMVQDGFKPDKYTYHSLMAELCWAERLGDVTALFHEMLIQGTTLHMILHSRLSEFLFRIDEDQLLGIIEESAKKGVAAVDNGCITLLKELCRIEKVSGAEKVLQTFAKAGLVPTTEMYNIVIEGYCSNREIEGAFLLCRQMQSHDQLVPNEATYEALLLAVLNNTSIDYWEDVLELFEKNGVSTDALSSSSSAKYGFKDRNSLVPRMLRKLVDQVTNKLF